MEENKETDMVEVETETEAAVETEAEEAAPTEEDARGRSKFVYGIRIACGAYLAYLSWKLIPGLSEIEGWHRVIVSIAAGAFAVIGIALVILSVRRLIGEGKK